mgnify:CR=1 FL=1
MREADSKSPAAKAASKSPAPAAALSASSEATKLSDAEVAEGRFWSAKVVLVSGANPTSLEVRAGLLVASCL